MASIFTKIINGEIPSIQIAESKNCLAIMDMFPLRKGHVLVIPKEEVDDFFDLDDDTMTELMLFSKKIAIALKKTIDCTKVGMSVVGLEVPHAHVHLIPINNANDINFVQDKLKMSQEDIQQIADEIKKNLK